MNRGYSGAHQNPNGTWVCGGAHTGAHNNPSGKWVCGGAHTSAHKNPNGEWVCGGAHTGDSVDLSGPEGLVSSLKLLQKERDDALRTLAKIRDLVN